MSNDIKVGDLVWAERPTKCCGKHAVATPVFKVSRISNQYYECSGCGRKNNGAIAWIDGYDNRVCALYRLEKFRDFPESELRDETRELETQS